MANKCFTVYIVIGKVTMIANFKAMIANFFILML